jgi:hypothetical protein
MGRKNPVGTVFPGPGIALYRKDAIPGPGEWIYLKNWTFCPKGEVSLRSAGQVHEKG